MVALLILAFVSILDSLVAGGDPMRRYTPADYSAAFQNWDIRQLSDGRLLAANTDGVLVFDGAAWKLYELPGNRQARTIGIDLNGTVWVGGEGWIGRMAPDPRLGFRFETLLDDVSGDVWTIVNVGADMVAQATDEVVWWRNGTVRRVQLRTGAYPAMWVVDTQVILQEYGIGWVWLNGVERTPISGLEPLTGMMVVSFLERKNGDWVVVTRDNGIYQVRPGRSALNRIPLNLPESYSARFLADGSLAVGTIRNGLHILSSDFKRITKPGQEYGVHLDAVWAIREDDENHVWLATDRGLVQWFRYEDIDVWDSRSGLTGNVHAVARFEDRVWVGTSTGLFVGHKTGFRSVTGVNQPVWAFLEWNGSFLIGTSEGLGFWDGRQLQPTPIRKPVYSLHADVRDRNRLWVGVAGGLLTADLVSGRLRISEVRGVDLDIRNIIQTQDRVIWAGTSRGGVLRISDGIPDVLNPTPGDSRVAMSGSDVYAGNADGLWKWDPSLNRFEPWPKAGGAGVYRLTSDPGGMLWMVRFDPSGSWIETFDGEARDDTQFRRLPNRGLLRIVPDGEQAWIGTTSGLFRVDLTKTYQPKPMKEAVLRAMSTGSVTTIRFGSPWLEDAPRTEYRYRIGSGDDWTEWSKNAEAVMVDLWEGRYELTVEARNKYGDVSRATVGSFRIPPPLYRTWWAYLTYVVLLAGLYWTAVSATRQYNRRRTLRLTRLVRERTAEVVRNQTELKQANRTLTQLVDQKNTILGIAAHDLKNPLATIHGFSELLSMTLREADQVSREDRDEILQQIGYIQEASGDMSQIISDLLDSVLIDKGGAEMRQKAFDLGTMMAFITESYRPLADKKDISIQTELVPERKVNADPDRMQEVFVNLVSNAVKYTRLGGKVRIGMSERSDDEGSWVSVDISDEGPGFTEQDKAHMFGMFKRLSAAPTAGERSNGVGLYIVKHFTELNGGRIELETVPGEGSTFRIWLRRLDE